MRAALALLILLAPVPAAADPCAKFDAPLAYNACLARQGPAARAVNVGKASTAPGNPVRGRVVATRRRGRSELVFSVGR